jgi:hypothetical protein
LNATRRVLYRIEPEVTVELVGQLLKTANGEDGVRELLRVPRMQQHLAPCERQLSGLGMTLDGRRRPHSQPAQEPLSDEPRQYDRDRLYEEVWSEPAKDVCRKYGIAEAKLFSLCRTLEIPAPSRGHWPEKNTARLQSPRPRLLPLGFRRSRG